jgi:hypothetical protein
MSRYFGSEGFAFDEHAKNVGDEVRGYLCLCGGGVGRSVFGLVVY